MPELSLAGIWQASWGDGLHGWTRQFLQPMHDPQRYISMHFPGSIQANLIEAGIIEDPRLGLNSLKARWKRSISGFYARHSPCHQRQLKGHPSCTSRFWMVWLGLR